MPRYKVQIPTPYTPEEVNNIINSFSETEEFKFDNYKGEEVLKKGSGFLTAPQFIKVTITPDIVYLEAWLKIALLPGVYVGEMGLTGFYGFALKKILKERVENLVSSISGQPFIIK